MKIVNMEIGIQDSDQPICLCYLCVLVFFFFLGRFFSLCFSPALSFYFSCMESVSQSVNKMEKKGKKKIGLLVSKLQEIIFNEQATTI